MKSPVTAVLVKLPNTLQDSLWTSPERFVDKRNIIERIFNINTDKIYKKEASGIRFPGPVYYDYCILQFDQDVELNKKIEKVDTIDHCFLGVIPIQELDEGTVCTIDYYK